MTVLVIVESPSKAKKIQAYLGRGYTVRASLGHIRDLPSNKEEIPEKYAAEAWAKLGVQVDAGFKPLYVIPKGKKEVVKSLKALAGTSDRVLLATDPDREGEAIAWHLARVLGLTSEPERMTFQEITKTAIEYAAQHPRKLDYALVGAQESRRILDRLVGYGFSPVLWNSIGGPLSAGRVQSAALAMLAEREQSRLRFVPAQYWRITAKVQASPAFTVLLTHVRGQPVATPKDFAANGALKGDGEALHLTPVQAQQLVGYLNGKAGQIQAVEQRPYSSRPPAPFVTSTLQQEASKQLGLSPDQTMKVAQTLYEDGRITYMRTDSPGLSAEATQAARDVAVQRFGPASVPPAPRVYAAKDRNAQEAHEAVRPSGSVWTAPEHSGLEGEFRALYDLIYRRTVASQMLDLLGTLTTISVQAGVLTLTAGGRTVLEPGYTRIYQDGQEDEEEVQVLPDVQQDQSFPLAEARAEDKRTTAPGRFSEASLVRALEKAGVGRPSTFAATVATLRNRGYLHVKGKKVITTWLGLLVHAYLREHCAAVVNLKFTAEMEADLDRIAEGQEQREAYLTRAWTEQLAPLTQRAPRRAPVLQVPRVPGATVTAQDGVAVLCLDGRRAALPLDSTPDDLTPELAAKILSGDAGHPPKKGKAAGQKKARAGSAKTTPKKPRKKKDAEAS